MATSQVARVFETLAREGAAAGKMVVVAVSETLTKKPRPQALNTVGLLKIASKAFGIGPQAAMHAAENLYLQVSLMLPKVTAP
jgi:DNA topoisomerase-3